MAQPVRDWDKTLGSQNWDELHVLLPTPDGGFLLGGNVTAAGGEVTGQAFGYNDYWLVKTDAHGKKIWDKTYGGTGDDRLWQILPLADGGYLLGGSSSSGISGNKYSSGRGKQDFWLVRVSETGEKLWEKTIGGSQRDECFVLREFPDATFLVGGWTASGADGDKTSDSLGVYDIWILKMDKAGNILRQRQLGGPQLDNLYDAAPTPDGGFLLGGSSASGKTATKSQDCRGYSDYWVIKINEDLESEWDARFGGSDVDQLEKIVPLHDGNFLLLGASMSPKSGDRTAKNFGSFDFWALKINPLGQKLWDTSYGGSGFDGGTAALETPAGNLMFLGTSSSPPSGMKQSPNYGGYDYWLIRADSLGNVFWEKSYGGPKSDAATELLQLPNGAMVLGGHSESPAGGFKSENPRGYNDFWLLKTFCNIQFDLPADTVLCLGQPVELEIFPKDCTGTGCEFYWSNGSRENPLAFTPDSSGQLSLLVLDGNECRATDTLNYTVAPAPTVTLPADTVVFADGPPLLLDASQPSGDFQYLWSNGPTTGENPISVGGEYIVTVTSEASGCTTVARTIVRDAARNLFFPNVINPDLDIFNDTWFVQSAPGAVEELALIEVYDRWTHRLFHAEHAQPNTKQFGWDGTDNGGERVRPGVYTFMVVAKYPGGREETFFGTIGVVR